MNLSVLRSRYFVLVIVSALSIQTSFAQEKSEDARTSKKNNNEKYSQFVPDHLIEAGGGVNRTGKMGSAMLRYQHPLENWLAIGSEVSAHWSSSKSYSSSGTSTENRYEEEEPQKYLSSLTFTSSLGWPSISSGIYALGQVGVGHFRNNTVFQWSTSPVGGGAVVKAGRESVEKSHLAIVSGINLGARHTFDFGLSIGLEGMLKSLLPSNSVCLSPSWNPNQRACSEADGAAMYHVLVGYAF